MEILFANIGRLYAHQQTKQPLRGKALASLPSLANAWMLVKNGRIEAIGQHQPPAAAEVVDLQNATIFPTWVDSHTHLVFAATREQEFVQKIQGKSYAEIAAAGGGILNSAAKLQASSEDLLFAQAQERLAQLLRWGTGAVEIKTGYGLTVEAELKMLRVIRRLKQWAPIPVKATLLAAHSLPMEFKNRSDDFVQMVVEEMIPAAAADHLADYVDVFCEQGFFSNEQTVRICAAAASFGIRPRIHANQLSCTGAVQAAIEAGALSVDHLEQMDDASIEALAASSTIGTLLPTAAYFIRLPFPPARQMIDTGAALALASDYNPGSSPSGNMHQVVSMACVQMKMLPEEAINAATINAAAALGLGDDVGSLWPGKLANFMAFAPGTEPAAIPYHFGGPIHQAVYLKGQRYC